jgi:hypothetical protein
MNIIDQIKKIIDTNQISDTEILELREYFSSVLTEEESEMMKTSMDYDNEYYQNSLNNDPYFDGTWECGKCGTINCITQSTCFCDDII